MLITQSRRLVKKPSDPHPHTGSSVYLLLHNSFSVSIIGYYLALKVFCSVLFSFVFSFLGVSFFSSFPLRAFYVSIILWPWECLAPFQEYNGHCHFGPPLPVSFVSGCSVSHH